MTLEQFRYVIEVERTGSINKAAANLYMTQSALSLSILNLEKELGSTIFARTKKGTVLTPFGKTLLQYLRPLHEQIEQVNKLFVQGKARDNMTLKIANDGFTVASLICSMLYDKYRPVGLRIEHFDSSGDQARSMVADHMAEIGIIRIWNCYEKIEMRQLDTLGLAFHPLIEGSLAVAVGMGSPLYHDKSIEYVTPDMLQKYPRVRYGYEDWGFLSGNMAALGIYDLHPSIVTSSRAVINDMQSYTDAYYITTNVPENLVCSRRTSTKRYLPLNGVDNIRSKIGWISLRNTALSQIAMEFTMLLEQWYRGDLSEEMFCEKLHKQYSSPEANK